MAVRDNLVEGGRQNSYAWKFGLLVVPQPYTERSNFIFGELAIAIRIQRAKHRSAAKTARQARRVMPRSEISASMP